jgi:hypothetical protein
MTRFDGGPAKALFNRLRHPRKYTNCCSAQGVCRGTERSAQQRRAHSAGGYCDELDGKKRGQCLDQGAQVRYLLETQVSKKTERAESGSEKRYGDRHDQNLSQRRR